MREGRGWQDKQRLDLEETNMLPLEAWPFIWALWGVNAGNLGRKVTWSYLWKFALMEDVWDEAEWGGWREVVRIGWGPHPILTYRNVPRGQMAWHPQKNLFFTAQCGAYSECWLAGWMRGWTNEWVDYDSTKLLVLTCIVISLPSAIYLCKRTMQNKARLELADYEAVSMIIFQVRCGRRI